jgi:hypothetical protein
MGSPVDGLSPHTDLPLSSRRLPGFAGGSPPWEFWKNRKSRKNSWTFPEATVNSPIKGVQTYFPHPRRVPMRTLRAVTPGTLLVALMLQLVFCADTEACWRGRHRQRCYASASCGPQCCLHCFDIRNCRGRALFTEGFCWCCEGMKWVRCDANCGTGPFAYTSTNTPPSNPCMGKEAMFGPCQGDSNFIVCCMICDPVWHVMRPADPCEPGSYYISICYLWTHCDPPAR